MIEQSSLLGQTFKMQTDTKIHLVVGEAGNKVLVCSSGYPSRYSYLWYERDSVILYIRYSKCGLSF